MPYVSNSSGLKSASTAICAMSSKLDALTVIGGSDAATATVYDNASAASGTVLMKVTAAANTTVSVPFTSPVDALNGLYVAITGTSPGVIVHFHIG